MTNGEFDQMDFDARFWAMVPGATDTGNHAPVATAEVYTDPAVLALKTANFLEYFKQVFPAFDDDAYGRRLDEELCLENDVPCMLRAYAGEIVAQFAAVDYDTLTDFGTLERIAKEKQLRSAELGFVHEDSLWLRRMLDLVCPVGPEVSTVDPEETDRVVRETYGRPIARLATFGGVRSAAYKEIEDGFWYEFHRCFKGQIGTPGLLRYIVELGALQGLRRWEDETSLEDTPELEAARERMDGQAFSEADRKHAMLAVRLGIDSNDLTERLEGLLEMVRDYTFAELESVYEENQLDQDD